MVAAGGAYRLSLQAPDGGVVQAPKLTLAAGMNLELDATGGVEVGQFTDFTAGRLAFRRGSGIRELADATGTAIEISAVHVELPLLQTLTDGKLILRGRWDRCGPCAVKR